MRSGQAISPELREWVAAQLAAGHSVPSLRASMRAAGWHDDAADAALQGIEMHVAANVARVYGAYQERLRSSSAVDFDDLLVHLVTSLRQHRHVRADLDARFRYILVDEYQDTNLAQYAIVRGALPSLTAGPKSD